MATKWIPDEATGEAMGRAPGGTTAGRDGCGPRPSPGRSGKGSVGGRGRGGEEENDHGMGKWGIKRLSGSEVKAREEAAEAQDLG